MNRKMLKSMIKINHEPKSVFDDENNEILPTRKEAAGLGRLIKASR